MRFEDFVLQFDASSRGGFRARVLKSPFGEGTHGFSLSALAAATVDPVSGATREAVHRGAVSLAGCRPPHEVGAELFRSVFQGQVRTLLDKSRGQVEVTPELGLRFKIKIDPQDEETGALADLPWELLCDETEDFFALSRRTSLIRYLDVPRSSQPIPLTPPLRILAVDASPTSLQPLDLMEEMRFFRELNESSAGIEVEFLSHASAGAVREALAGDTFNVLHFMGHGTFDGASGEGMLAFEKRDGSADLVSGRAFATKLRDLHNLGVVVLNACDTARAGNQGEGNPFRGVATALVWGGVPAVVAMQRPISDLAAIAFSAAFYRQLVRGVTIDEALTEGRQAIHSVKPDSFEWATPVLFLRVPGGDVFVAKAAAAPADRSLAVPAPAAVASAVAAPILAPTVARHRQGMAVKIVAGAAGALLVTFVVYTKVLGPESGSIGEDSIVEKRPMSTEIEPTSAPNAGADPELKAPRAPGRSPREKQSDQRVVEEKVSRSTPPRSAVQQPVQSAPAVDPAPQSTAQQPAAQQPTPQQPAVVEVATATPADLSGLSAQVVSIIRRDEGGLRLTVSFRNSASQRLSAALDAASSVLSDNQGQRYSILGSDLPSAGSNLRLDLEAGASARHTFDFQAPKLGSNRFFLALADEQGGRIRVAGSPVALGGPS